MSILNVNKINPVGGGSTITIAGIASVTSSVTAPSFVGAVTGNVTGNVTGDATGLSGNPSINTTGIVTATAFNYTGNQNLSNRNIIINGAMQVSQRSTSATTSSSGYYAVDRMRVSLAGLDEGITIAQSTLTSSDTPYTQGLRYATKITNGNQTSGAGSGDTVALMYRFEGQDINSSGWEYTNSSSFITISFWIKSSVAQTFYLRFRMTGSSVVKEYVFAVNATTSWQKITQAIPGATGVDAVNTTAEGGFLFLVLFHGTDQTGSITINQWNTASSTRVPNMTSTWYTTNDATIEITGLQMEVGPVATPFEHRSFADELMRCYRYFYGPTGEGLFGVGRTTNASTMWSVQFPTQMRGGPSLSITSTTITIAEPNQSNFNITSASIANAHISKNTAAFYLNGTMSVSVGDNLFLTDDYLMFDAEL